MPTPTTTYSFQKPTVGGDGDAWGTSLNANFDALDDVLDGTLPITPSTGNDIEIRGTNAATNTVTTLLTLNSQSSNTPANGIGSALAFAAETAAGNTEIGVVLEAVTTDVTNNSEDFDLVIKTMAAGATAAERLRLSSGTSTFAMGLSVGGNLNITSGGLQRGGVNAYALRSITYLTSGTAATYTPPSNCRALRVTCVGGGGGGGGTATSAAGEAGCAGGGGAGAEVSIFLTSLAASYTYTIGAGGSGGAAGANAGSVGGNTTFTGTGVALTAGGGQGGSPDNSSSTNSGPAGGAGGTATGGNLNRTGNAGGRGRTQSGFAVGPGSGGVSQWGSIGTAGATSGTIGADAGGYGAGGGGASAQGSTAAQRGGNGSPGLIIVEEFF